MADGFAMGFCSLIVMFYNSLIMSSYCSLIVLRSIYFELIFFVPMSQVKFIQPAKPAFTMIARCVRVVQNVPFFLPRTNLEKDVSPSDRHLWEPPSYP